MRVYLCFLCVLAACGKGERNDESKTPSTPAIAHAAVFDAAVAKASSGQDAGPKAAPTPSPRRWGELLEHTSLLERKWSSLSEEDRMVFYEDWTRKARELASTLRESADSSELEKLYQQDPRPVSLQFSAEEGFAYAARVSPSWLLKTFPELPKREKEFLAWLEQGQRDSWFAEGNLEVSISAMTRSYQKGAALLSAHKSGFRATDIGEELDAMMRDITSLLTQPPSYAKKKYQRELRAAFVAMTKVERHAAAAKALIDKFPPSGVPYAFDEVESLREELGLLK